MWILESDGEFLKGKRTWLRPGSRYLFGRVKKEGVAHAIDHKTISRKHFVIEIAAVQPGQGSQVHVRSRVTITDEKTKGGTFVDGVELRDGSRELKGLEHTIRPGKYPYDLRIKWHQVCLSFSFSSKELKANPLAAKRERLEHLDIKTIIEYVVGETTHVVTNKRNTAKGLQALINGKHIVNNSYIDALVYAATSEDLAEPENLSPLERDFDGAWPDPTEHLPPPGKEVIDMPKADLEAAFLPKSERRTMFEEFTFVFCSKEQFENLLPVVTNGHGKALQYPLEIGRTTADELEQYMHNAAGRKGLGGTATQSVRGGVILVRPVLKGDMQKWADDLADAVSVRVNQRPIDQGDFLKIILNQDRYLLRRPCETSGDLEDVAGPSSQFETAKATLKTLQNSSPLKPLTRALTPPDESEQPPPKRQRRDRIIKSRFDAFDDGLDVDIAAIPAHAPTHQYTPGGVSQSHVRDFDSSQRIAASQLQAKIAESPSDHDNDMEDLLPAAAAMKRHRLEMEQKGKRQAKAATTDVLEVVKKPKKEREIDILEAARKRREAEEEAIRQDREALAHAGVDVENVRNLAVIVEMELPVRNNRSSRADGVQSDRWDARWNGRKNFKQFRRKGENSTRPRQTQNVIIPLQEAKKTSYGIGQEYWHDSGHSSIRETTRSNTSQNQLRSTAASQPLSDRTSPTISRLQEEAEEITGTIDVDEPRSTRHTQHSSERSQAISSGKRTATSQSGSAPKRQRTLHSRPDDDSDDELKFRFGRRKK